MLYVVLFLAGVAAGMGPLVIWYHGRLSLLRVEKLRLKGWDERLKSYSSDLAEQENDLKKQRGQLDGAVESLEAQKVQHQQELIQAMAAFKAQQVQDQRGLDQAMAAFEARKVGYDDLLKENGLLKQDLFNLSVQLRKMERDHAAIGRRQEEIDQKANELATRYLDENVSWIANKLTAKNFATCKDRLTKVVSQCRDIGFDVSQEKEDELVQALRKNFERAVRAEFEREEQARIRAQIREEEKLNREIEKQIQEAEREQAAVEGALQKALQEARDEYSAEVEHLKAKLKEAEEKAQRAKSRAEMTKAGYVYVLSNIGSFGDGVFKVGMTRRLEPMDRVRELGDASVPFPFDVHMMISCDDAPTLENALHREFHKQRLNRVNFRKEFFRVDLESIRKVVEARHGEVDYVADAEALQYRDTLAMTDQDYEFVEETVQSVWDDHDATNVDE